MLYRDYLKKLEVCPFCSCDNRVLVSNEHAYLTYAKAPYHKHHLLVTTKKHKESLFSINKIETRDIDKLIEIGTKILRELKYNNFTILVREGDNSNKSIKHLHYHLIPDDPIGDLNHIGKPRVLLSKKQTEALSNQVSLIVASLEA